MSNRWRNIAALAAVVPIVTVLTTGCTWFGGPGKDSGNGDAGEKSPSASQSASAAPSPTATPVPTATPDPIRQQVQRMSLDEKIGQLVLVGVDGTTMGEQAKAMVTEHRVGGFILYKDNITNAQQTTALLNELKQTNADAPAPLLIGVDQEGGKIDRLTAIFEALPTNRAIGKVGSTAFSIEIGARLGEELNTLGFNMDFAPVLDVDSNPDNPVIGDRSFGPSASLVSKLGIATMEGLRSKGVVPVVKHFPGHGDTSVDSHRSLPRVDKSLEDLKRLELVPFTDAIKQGADAVMIAHILLPKLDNVYPASFSKTIITDLLRNELHYDGVVMTDDMTMGAVLQNYPIGEAAFRAVQAGVDIVMVAHDNAKQTEVIRALKKNVEDGLLPMTRIDESVYRILKLKQQYKLADKPAGKQDIDGVNARIRETLKKYAPGK